MKSWKIFCCVSLLLLTMVFAGCGNDGDKYVGTWTGLSKANEPLSDLRQVTIEKGKNNKFIVKEKIGHYSPIIQKKYEWDEFEDTDEAIFKDDKLIIGGTSFEYIEEDNTLLYKGNGKYYLSKDDTGNLYNKLKDDGKPFAIKRYEKTIADAKELNKSPFEKYGNLKWK